MRNAETERREREEARIAGREREEEETSLKDKQRNALLEKYGGEEHLDSLPRELLLGETEQYVEYSRDGRVIKGQEKAVAKSKYEEDAYINNHTSVWGSWYDLEAMSWGYQCCHSDIKQSYCTGEAGKAAKEESLKFAAKRAMLEPAPSAADRRDEAPLTSKVADLYGEQLAPELDPKKLRKAMKKARKRRHAATEEDEETDERKRKYNSLKGGESGYDVTVEDMEVYKMERVRAGDTMADYVDKEEED